MAVQPLSLLLFAVAVLLSFPRCAASLSSLDYESMEPVLRSHGYNLFYDAMAAASDVTLPPNATFTIFAASDASLLALHIDILVHVVPLRLSLSDLRSISSGSILPTLLPYTALRLTTDPLQVAGVDVALPGLFYSPRVAVHGLAGVMTSVIRLDPVAPSPAATLPEIRRYLGEKNSTNSTATSDKSKKWVTGDKVLCALIVIAILSFAGGVYWGLVWLGLICDAKCEKRFGDLKGKNELSKKEITDLKQLKSYVEDMAKADLTTLLEAKKAEAQAAAAAAQAAAPAAQAAAAAALAASLDADDAR